MRLAKPPPRTPAPTSFVPSLEHASDRKPPAGKGRGFHVRPPSVDIDRAANSFKPSVDATAKSSMRTLVGTRRVQLLPKLVETKIPVPDSGKAFDSTSTKATNCLPSADEATLAQPRSTSVACLVHKAR